MRAHPAHRAPTPPTTGERDPHHSFPGLSDQGHGQATRWRFAPDGHDTPRTTQMWTRPRIPPIAERTTSGVEQTLIVTDPTNGLSPPPQRQRPSTPSDQDHHPAAPSPRRRGVHALPPQPSDDGPRPAQATPSDTNGHLGEVTRPLLVRQH